MSTIALIGPDGAGKTTLTQMLAASGSARFRYLYMGTSARSSNLALPTTMMRARLPRRRLSAGPAHFRAVARLANRVADAWFRQLAAWYFHARGYVVLCDRHFTLDYAPEITAGRPPSFDRRIYSWLMTHLFPKPSLVILLDAPGEVLFARKGELNVQELERRRQGFLQQAGRFPRFVSIDATQSLEVVFEQVASHVAQLSDTRKRGPWGN